MSSFLIQSKPRPCAEPVVALSYPLISMLNEQWFDETVQKKVFCVHIAGILTGGKDHRLGRRQSEVWEPG